MRPGARVPELFIYLRLIEALYIGGWVFLWESISTMTFRGRSVMERYGRFLDSPIRLRPAAPGA